MGTGIAIALSVDPPTHPPLPTPPELSFIRLESTDYVLLENGNHIQVEF